MKRLIIAIFDTAIVALTVIIVVIGFTSGGLRFANAHSPCGEDYQPPQCGYIQVVNPLSGKLEQQYICE